MLHVRSWMTAYRYRLTPAVSLRITTTDGKHRHSFSPWRHLLPPGSDGHVAAQLFLTPETHIHLNAQLFGANQRYKPGLCGATSPAQHGPPDEGGQL